MNEHKKKARLFPLDFVRVIGAVLIVLFHFNMSLYLFPGISFQPLLFLNYANGNIGHIGVSLFFILSGASLMYTYEAGLKPADYFKSVSCRSILCSGWPTALFLFTTMGWAGRSFPTFR